MFCEKCAVHISMITWERNKGLCKDCFKKKRIRKEAREKRRKGVFE